MRFLTCSEADDWLAPAGWHVVLNEFWQTTHLHSGPTDQPTHRVGGIPICEPDSLPYFLAALNRLLPNNRERLLWIERTECTDPTLLPGIQALRAGLGEQRDFLTAPGLLFDSLDYSEEDQTRISDAARYQTSILITFSTLFLAHGWTAKLRAEGTQDFVEFWEGHVLFVSTDPQRVSAANILFDQYSVTETFAD